MLAKDDLIFVQESLIKHIREGLDCENPILKNELVKDISNIIMTKDYEDYLNRLYEIISNIKVKDDAIVELFEDLAKIDSDFKKILNNTKRSRYLVVLIEKAYKDLAEAIQNKIDSHCNYEVN